MIAAPLSRVVSLAVALMALVAIAVAQAPQYVEPVRPAKNRVAGVKVGPPPSTTAVNVPIITWGGDAATLLANGGTSTTPASAFGKAGLNVKLAKQDDFVVQVRDYIEGRSPFLRGTVGMINTYSELLNADARTAPVVVLQLTWSSGGDCLVVRDGINAPADLRGRVYLLNVRASWCVACREEHPLLVELARAGGVTLIGLNYKDQREDALKWLKALGDPYQFSLADTDGRVGIELGVYGVPETFVIDGDGVIRYKHIGPITPQILAGTLLPKVAELSGAAQTRANYAASRNSRNLNAGFRRHDDAAT